MKRFTHFHRFLVAGILAAAAAWPFAHLAHAGPTEPAAPIEIQIPAGNKVFLVGHAVGVQIYACNATSSGYVWSFAGPRADLYDDHGKLLTTHFGGPTWQAKDGSKVKGTLAGRVTVDAAAIPWLKLAAVSPAAGPDGDRLAGTTFIQRIATTGGLEPAAADCNAAVAGSVEEVPYTADYYFWKATGA